MTEKRLGTIYQVVSIGLKFSFVANKAAIQTTCDHSAVVSYYIPTELTKNSTRGKNLRKNNVPSQTTNNYFTVVQLPAIGFLKQALNQTRFKLSLIKKSSLYSISLKSRWEKSLMQERNGKKRKPNFRRSIRQSLGERDSSVSREHPSC